MKNLSFCLLLVILSACGGKSSDKSPAQNEAHCLCLPMTKYQLFSPQAFPEKMKIVLNYENSKDFVLLDECSAEQFSVTDYKIQRSANSGIIEGNLRGFVRGNLEIEITDLGADCTNDGIFYHNDNVTKDAQVLSDHEQNLIITL